MVFASIGRRAVRAALLEEDPIVIQGGGALHGVRVVEWGSLVAAPYSAKLLADLGADVIKVEELPRGDAGRDLPPFPGDVPHPDRSGLFQYLNAGKRSVALDLRRPDDASALGRLFGWADIVVHDQPPGRLEELGLGLADASRIDRALVVTSITPFGLTGPYRHWRACNMVLSHLSGLGLLTYWEGLDPEKVPPQRPPSYGVDLATGAVGALAALAGLQARDIQRQPQLVDVSGWEAAVYLTLPSVLYPAYEHRALNYRRPHRAARAPMGYLKCRDGYVWAAVLTPKHWEGFTAMLGVPELSREPLFDTNLARGDYWDVLEPILAAKVIDWPKDKLVREGQLAGIPIAPVYDVGEAVDSEQVRARGFLVSVDEPVGGSVRMPGNPCRLSATPPASGPAPMLGQHTAQVLAALAAHRRPTAPPVQHPGSAGETLPLSGVRVLDLSWVHAGPQATRMLAHLGAEVIKIESDRIQDIGATNPPFAEGGRRPGTSGYYASLAAGKKTCTIDLSLPEGLALAKRLVKISDVVVENFSVGTIERLGLGYEELKRIRPDVILLSISGLGQTGPHRAYRLLGLQISAMSGLSLLSSVPGLPPAVTHGAGADPIGALYATLAALAALRHRRATGVGQRIDISMLEAMLAHVPDAVLEVTLNGRVPESAGNAEHGNAPVECFRCRGVDAWVAIAVHDDAEWAGLCRALADPSLPSDVRFATAEARRVHAGELSAIITGWTARNTPATAMAKLQAEGVPAGAVYDSAGVIADRHFAGRGYMEEIDHHVAGVRLVPGVPWKIGGSPAPSGRRRVPQRNEFGDYVLRGLLGLSVEEIADLRAKGVIPRDPRDGPATAPGSALSAATARVSTA